MSRWPWSRLVWRLYAVGLSQLILVAAAAILIGATMTRLIRRGDVQVLAERLAPVAQNHAKLTAELAEVRKRENILLSIYSSDGQLIASNCEPPLRAPPWGSHLPSIPHPGEARSERPGTLPRFPSPPELPEMYARIALPSSEGVLVARPERPKLPLTPPLLTLLSGLLVVGVGAFFTARVIARPLERLSRAAVAFGGGNLAARAAIRGNDELGEVLATFDEMADRIQALVTAEKELLANAAHELRTPLARIRVALEIAAEGDAEVARTSLSEIAHDLTELESLVDDVLSVTRFELVEGGASPRSFALHIERVLPRSIAEQAAARFRSRHPQRPLELSLAEQLPRIEADPVLFRRVVDNLLENAHKYSPDPAQPIVLALSGDSQRVRFEIIDQGRGIPTEDLPRVFSAFFRGDRSRSRTTGGVGLGLTLAKRIVDAHGGTIEVTSTSGQGTRVRVELLACPVESEAIT